MEEIKLVVLGSGGVGKSALTVQFVQNIFIAEYDPTIEDSYRTKVDISGSTYSVEILDTAGTEQFMAMRDLYIRNGQGFVCVYDITSKASFDELAKIHDNILLEKELNVPIIIVGNKCDLENERVVSIETAMKYCQDKNCLFIEASAKDKTNVSQLFNQLIEKIVKQVKIRKNKKSSICHII